MSFLSNLKKIGQVAETAGKIAEIAVPIAFPQAAPIVSIADTAINLIAAVTKDGKLDVDDIAKLNVLLIPYGFAIVHYNPQPEPTPVETK